jgi:glutamate N-acetyltransferase/amino-acid N-acetyltransferase
MDPGAVALPAGFRSHVANIGIKDETDDFLVLAADAPCPAAAVFTRSRFAGPSVTLSRRHVADGRLQAFVVVSTNANVANGPVGDADAAELAAGVGRALGAEPGDVLVASIGRSAGRTRRSPRTRHAGATPGQDAVRRGPS